MDLLLSGNFDTSIKPCNTPSGDPRPRTQFSFPAPRSRKQFSFAAAPIYRGGPLTGNPLTGKTTKPLFALKTKYYL